MKKKALVFVSILILGCNRNPYRASNKIYKKETKNFAKIIREEPVDYFHLQDSPWIGAVNFDLRKPNFVIIHHTAQNGCPETLHTFTIRQSQVSAHYVICKDGTVHHMLNDYLRAWQAGLSKWGNNTDINSSSIGIELDNNGFEDFAGPQINSLLVLLDTLKTWKILADHGFGDWYDDTSRVIVPAGFNNYQALRIIGYNLKDSLAAIASFRRHWLQDSVYQPFDSATEKILYNLSQKYQ